MSRNGPSWKLDELCSKVAFALESGYQGQRNGQVREFPDARTIRYYATIGLVDRPAGFRGRTALYGRRHLLQVVALKRLQARGLPLARIQEELLGLSPKALERLAALPAGVEETGAAGGAGEGAPPRAAGTFWKERPAAAIASPAAARAAGPSSLSGGPIAGGPPAADPPVGDGRPVAKAQAGAAPAVFQAVEIARGAVLLLGAGRPLSPDDAEALRAAAAPLLAEIERRGLAGGRR